ncbi:MAG: M20 family metallopeptidase [Thermoguttaceae bacterium]|nr:M20 family metallopeptidase [Thermoguttaceae bacterium]MDW8039538.1 M20 family metallopeptidase [Thermoguttaceae bacterium]
MTPLDPVQLLQQLVRIPSVNPMERSFSAPLMAGSEAAGVEADRSEAGSPEADGSKQPKVKEIFCEGRLTDFLEQFCRQVGLEVFRQPVLPGRENLIVRLVGYPPPEQGGEILLWDAHQDTVPPGQMAEPFAAQIRQGRLYGRGACDVKGGLAAMLTALARLASESDQPGNGSADPTKQPRSKTPRPAVESGVGEQGGSAWAEEPREIGSGRAKTAPRPTVYLAATIDEEHGMNGARALCRLWKTDDGKIFPRRPDAAIVAEPTDLQVVVAHKGVIRWRCHTLGQACHSSRPHEGLNAIYLMAEVLQALQQYASQIVPHLGWHPLCGSGSLSVGRIYGGQSVNIVPDRCTIEIDRRLLPGESPQQAWEHCLKYLVGCLSQPDRFEQEPPWPPIPGLSDESNGQLAAKLSAVAAELTGKPCPRIAADYTTNAGFYAQAGVPTVVFGPGSIQQAHTADEWIPLDQLHQATQIFYQLVNKWYESL